MARLGKGVRRKVGVGLRRRRETLGLTARDVANELNARFDSKAHANHIHGYEGASRPIGTRRLFELAEVLAISVPLLVSHGIVQLQARDPMATEGPSHHDVRWMFVQSMAEAFKGVGAEVCWFHELYDWPRRLPIDLGNAMGPIQNLMIDVYKLDMGVEYPGIKPLVSECIRYLNLAYDAKKRVKGSRQLLFDACYWLVSCEKLICPPELLRMAAEPYLHLMRKVVSGYRGEEQRLTQGRLSVLEASVERTCAFHRKRSIDYR